MLSSRCSSTVLALLEICSGKSRKESVGGRIILGDLDEDTVMIGVLVISFLGRGHAVLL